MTGNVRKLALDIGFRWLVPIQILLALTADYFFLFDNQLSGLMTGGVMLALQGTGTTNKVALWRTLPVTQKEIGQARWWQMTGLPGIGIILVMGAALALHVLMTATGWTHLPMRADAMEILRGLLLQLFYPAFLAAFSLAIASARTSRSPFAYAIPIAVWAPWVLLLPRVIPLAVQTRLLLLGLIGLIAAVILYATASLWPQPVTQPAQMDIRGSDTAASKRAGQGGWTALWGMALLRPALIAGTILALYIAVIVALRLDRIVVLQIELFVPLILVLQINQFNATALRVLRALPGSTLQLAAYLFLLPLLVVGAAICGFGLLLEPWLTGDVAGIDVVALMAVLLATAPLLPAALAVRQAAMSLVLMPCMALVPLIMFGWDYVPQPWHDERLLAGLTALVFCACFLWMYVQISRGTRVYRLQPFVAARWRGDS